MQQIRGSWQQKKAENVGGELQFSCTLYMQAPLASPLLR